MGRDERLRAGIGRADVVRCAEFLGVIVGRLRAVMIRIRRRGCLGAGWGSITLTAWKYRLVGLAGHEEGEWSVLRWVWGLRGAGV